VAFTAALTERLDSLGDSIKTAVVVSWNKQPGDLIKEDDVIAVVETDKVSVDIRSSKTGKFVEGLHATGAEVNVGDELYKIDTDTSGANSSSQPEKKAAPTAESGDDKKKSESKPEKTESNAASTGPAAPPPPSETKGDSIMVAVPIMGESISQGVLAKWNVAVNDHVSVDDIVASIETDKVNVEVRSPATGVIIEQFAKEGEEITVGGRLFSMSAKEKSGSKPAADKAKEQPKESKESKEPARESKSAEPKKEAPKEQKPAAKPAAAPSSGASKSSSKEAAPEGAIAGTYVSGERGETRVQMSRMRQRIAQRLKESQNTAAMLTTFQEIDMTYIIDLRNKHKDDFEKKHKVKLGFMSAFVKAASHALQELPAVNAVIDDNTHEIVYRNYIDISVAVASPTGLVVPVLRNTQDLNFAVSSCLH
jgi:2-oxoglutarate dehydrogenase E2 component (dihydrolipoamide succinyltransferase)